MGADHGEEEGDGGGTGSGSGEEALMAMATGTGTTSTGQTILNGSEKENQTALSGTSWVVDMSTTSREGRSRRPLGELELGIQPPEQPVPENDFGAKPAQDKLLPPLHRQRTSSGNLLEVPGVNKEDPSTISTNSRSARIMDAWDPPTIVPLLPPTGSEKGFVFNETADVVVQQGGNHPVVPGLTPAKPALGVRTSTRKTFRPKIKLSLNRGKSVFRPRLKERPLSRSKSDVPDSVTEGMEPSISMGEFEKKKRGPKALTVHTGTTSRTSVVPRSNGLEKVESHLPVIYPMMSPVKAFSWEEQAGGLGLTQTETVGRVEEQQGEVEEVYGGLYPEGRNVSRSWDGTSRRKNWG